ncbi:MAG TPA: hypothetical protein VM578_03920 [Candidatus Saccharimonadales bacterium]|nr:hypothetical protein [Candidatus Saccharimonadales bacterium]
MKTPRIVQACLLLPIFCAAGVASSSETSSQPQAPATSELEQRADHASGADCSHLSMQASRLLLEEANRQFGAGNVKAAHEEIDSSVRYAQRSVDCSLQVRKAEKSAEIELRKLIRRMKDVMQTLDSEDRPHLSQAIIELEKQRNRVLHGLFGAAAPGGATEKKP